MTSTPAARRLVAVIQARTTSERLPRKVLMPLGGRRVVEHVIAAAMSATLIDDVILATTSNAADDELAAVGKGIGVAVFRGSEDDVLGRFVGALRDDTAEVVSRLTADNPLLDPTVIDTVIRGYLEGGCDYASNNLERSWPLGMDTEVFSREALERADREGALPEHREHVTIFMKTNPGKFRLRNVTAPPEESWPGLRLTLDTQEDYQVLRRVFDALWTPANALHVGQVLEWLRAHPAIASLNAQVPQRMVFGRVF